MHVDGDANFRSDDAGQQVTFGGEARFLGAQVRGDADFTGAHFKGEAAFQHIRVEGNSFFGRDKKLQSTTFEGAAGFQGAIFEAYARFKRTKFISHARFENSHFHGAASFKFAEFAAEGETTFVGAGFERGAYFDSAKFAGDTDFTSAVSARDANFLDTEFSGPVSFREASFGVVHFGQGAEEKPGIRLTKRVSEMLHCTRFELEKSVDLRGFTYDRVYVDLEDLFSRIATGDRQPYTQLEQALRRIGDDTSANAVYLERRRVERQRMFSEGRYLRWATDCFCRALANYGIRPYRLAGYTLLLLVLGALFFSPPGAVKPKDDKRATATVSDAASYNIGRAIGVSVHQFLPIDVPVGSDWVPASGRVYILARISKRCVCVPVWPSVYGTFLRISGAILVGIGLGSITGLLRRVSP